MAMTTVLRLERVGAHWRARRRVFDVAVDGLVVATVAHGEAVAFAIAPGCHLVWLVSGGRRSPSVSFDAGDGETAAFRCHAARRGIPVLVVDPTALPLKGSLRPDAAARPA
jgi:hypothetical protein